MCVCAWISFYTEKLLHTAKFDAGKFLHKEAFTQRSFYTKKFLHRIALTCSKLLHREAFTQSSLHTEAFTHRAAFTQRSFTHKSYYTWQCQQLQLQNQISTPKPKKARFWRLFSKTLNRANHKRQSADNLLTNHHRDLHAAIPIRLTMFSCKSR